MDGRIIVIVRGVYSLDSVYVESVSGRKDLRCEDDIIEWGYKGHMNDVAATIGLENLKYTDRVFTKVLENADRYNDALGEYHLKYAPDRNMWYYLYTIRVRDRDKFIDYLADRGIMASKVHARNDTHTCFAESKTPLPGVDEYYSEQVSIPVGWWVGDPSIEYIIKTIRDNSW